MKLQRANIYARSPVKKVFGRICYVLNTSWSDNSHTLPTFSTRSALDVRS